MHHILKSIFPTAHDASEIVAWTEPGIEHQVAHGHTGAHKFLAQPYQSRLHRENDPGIRSIDLWWAVAVGLADTVQCDLGLARL